MDLNSYLEIARYLLLLLAGFWVARKARGPIRNIILSMMTPQQRMSDSSFHIQTRLGTILGFILALAIAAGLNWAVNEIRQWIEGPQKSQSTIFNTKPTTTPETTSPPPTPLSVSPIPSPFSPSEELPKTTIKMPNKSPSHPPPSSYDTPTLYLQVDAFQNQDLAVRLQARLQQSLDRSIWLALGRNPDHAPFKVLIGPFNNRLEALTYKQESHLDAFIQYAHNIRLLPE
ncbi:MAG: SPOR domain-containing protein [Saprospiraceae bacterium]|nr:SPOR domain-containing protein [Saprospiraceae bacterium]